MSNAKENTIDSAVFANTVRYFGNITGNRIYANAIIVADKKGFDMETAVKYVVGALKRVRTQALESGRNLSFASAVDVYETQTSDGGRKANIDAAFAQYDMAHHDAGRIASDIAQATQAAQDAQNETPDMVLAVKLWVEDFKRTLTSAKSVRLARIMSKYRAGEIVERNEAHYVTNYLAPKGIGALDFLEVVAKYA